MSDYAPAPILTADQTLSLSYRPWYPRYSTPQLGAIVRSGANIVDPDNSQVTAVLEDAEGNVLGTTTTVRDDVGLYHVNLTTNETDTPGVYSIKWIYAIGGMAMQPITFFEVGESSPAYETLPAGYSDIIEDVMIRLADLYDSPFGGPNLQTYVQANFGRNRIAQLMRIAVDRIAIVAQPYTTYDWTGVSGPPIDPGAWRGLLSQGTFVEVLKHLRRSYREQPTLSGSDISMMDRSRYSEEWNSEVQDEKADLESMIAVFKISQMDMGSPRVLVAGGSFGSLTYQALLPTGTPRYWNMLW